MSTIHFSPLVVSPCSGSFVSQSGWWRPALTNSFVSHCSTSFVSQSGGCPALPMSPSHVPGVGFQMLSLGCRQGFLSCCLVVFHFSLGLRKCHLTPRIGLPLPIVSKCLPFVTPLFPSCFSDVVSYFSPTCLVFVLQMWSSKFPDALSRFSPSCFLLNSHKAQFSPKFGPPIIS